MNNDRWGCGESSAAMIGDQLTCQSGDRWAPALPFMPKLSGRYGSLKWSSSPPGFAEPKQERLVGRFAPARTLEPCLPTIA